MKKWLLTPILLLWLTAAAQQADYRKLSAGVRRAVLTEQQRQRKAPGHECQPKRIVAFVQTDNQLGEDVLVQYDCKEYARQGDIAIVEMPLTRLAALSQHPAVKRIEANRQARLLMDTVPTIINALPVYQTTASHQAFTGKGVVLGLMDVGFDLTHPNFYTDATANGYRIKAFWDQLSPDTVGSRLPVGRDYLTEADILSKGCATDGRTETHGTHTLGIAAGSGYNSPYRGMAPESDICIVNNAVTSDTIYIRPEDYYKYTTATDALGFQYLFDYADQQGLPCVASFSEGYIGMDNEEDRLFATYLERLSAPGHLIVVSAGNEGYWPTYAEKPKGVQAAGAFLQPSGKQAHYRIQTDGSLLLHLFIYIEGQGTPTDTLTIASTDGRLDSLLTDTLFIGNDTCAISLSRHQSEFSNNMIYLLELNGNRKLSEMPDMALVAEGADSRVQMYGYSSCRFANRENIDPRWCAAAYGHNILAPAYFPSVICVGSTSHRLAFTNYMGEYYDYSSGREVGKRTPFSSMGPTMDGRIKPDVMAPGDNIVSSYSSYYLENNPEAGDIRSDVAHFDFNGRTYAWNSNAGTSMSCPAVAGTLALWLQAKPTLTQEEVTEVFSRTCRQPVDTLAYPNNLYGYGEIDAYRGLLDILGISKIDAVSQQQPSAVRIHAADGVLHLLFNELPPQPVSISIYATNGVLCHQQTLAISQQHTTMPLPSMASGIYAVQLTTGDSRTTGSQLIRR